MSHKREVILGALKALFSKGGSSAIAYAMTIIASRSLPEELCGSLFLALTLLFIFSGIVRLGVDNVIIKITSRAVNTSASIDKFAFISVYVSVFSIFSLFFAKYLIYYFWNSNEEIEFLTLVLWSIIPFTLVQIIGFYFQGTKNMFLSNFFQSGLIQLFILLILVVFVDESLDYIGWMFLWASTFSLLFAIIFFSYSTRWWRYKFNFPSRRVCIDIIRESFSMYPVIVMSLLVTWWSQLALGIFSDKPEIAAFAVCQRSAMLIGFIILAVNSISAPKFSYLYHNSKTEALKCTLLSSTRLALFLGFPMVFLALAFDTEILSVFGSSYSDYVNCFLILVLSQLFNILTGTVGQLLQMTGNQQSMTVSVMVSLVVNVVLSLVLIPQLGALGAAISYGLSFILQNLLAAYFVKEKFGFSVFDALNPKVKV